MARAMKCPECGKIGIPAKNAMLQCRTCGIKWDPVVVKTGKYIELTQKIT